MEPFLAITKALSDETRVRALVALADGELCACQLIELLGLSPSTVSKHMSILQQAGLIRRRKDGRWHYFRLAARDASPPVRRALRWTLDCLQDDATIAQDAEALEHLRTKDRKELSECYSTR